MSAPWHYDADGSEVTGETGVRCDTYGIADSVYLHTLPTILRFDKAL